MESQINIIDLPHEILSHVFSFVPLTYHKVFLWRVCTEWKNYFSFPRIPKYKIYELLIITGDLDNIKKIQIPKEYGLYEFQNSAVEYGYLSILKYLHKNKIGKMANPKTILCAVKYNRLEILKWLVIHSEILEQFTKKSCYGPGLFNLVKIPWHSQVKFFAIEYGHLDILIWLENELKKFDVIDHYNIALSATGYGHLHVLEYEISYVKNCYQIKTIFAEAARYDHLHILQWLKNKNYECDERVCSNAVLYRHLNILKWARENGCPWDKTTFECARKSDNPEILKWVIENGCPSV